MTTTQIAKQLSAKLGKEVHVVEYREWRGIKGFISWEHVLRANRFEGETILRVVGEMPKRLFINGKEYSFKSLTEEKHE